MCSLVDTRVTILTPLSGTSGVEASSGAGSGGFWAKIDLMRAASLSTLALAFALAGCVTLSEADQSLLRKHRVSNDLYARMLRHERLTLADVMELSEKRVNPEFILRYLRSSAAVYRLSSDDVVLLRRAGVKGAVIDYMLKTPSLFAPVVDPLWYDDPLWWDYPRRTFYYTGGRHYHRHHHHDGGRHRFHRRHR